MRRVRSGYGRYARVKEATITGAFQVLVAAALGVASGVLGGLFGVGGGVLAIPLLGIVYGVHQQMAQGTALVMVVPNVLFAFWRYRQQFGVDLRMAITIAAAALVTTYPTARLATGLDPDRLRLPSLFSSPDWQQWSPTAPGAVREWRRAHRLPGGGRRPSVSSAAWYRGFSASAAHSLPRHSSPRFSAFAKWKHRDWH
jgi:uncharacterized membrane protein YfcA